MYSGSGYRLNLSIPVLFAVATSGKLYFTVTSTVSKEIN